MIRYFPEETTIGFQEIPTEISLIIPFSGCGHTCKGCHSPQYQDKKNGECFSWEIFLNLMERYKEKVSCVCFFGGEYSIKLESFVWNTKYIYEKKVALYSGYNSIEELPHPEIVSLLDYIKLGQYKKELGGLDCKETNQHLYEIKNKQLIDITNKFWRE